MKDSLSTPGMRLALIKLVILYDARERNWVSLFAGGTDISYCFRFRSLRFGCSLLYCRNFVFPTKIGNVTARHPLFLERYFGLVVLW